LRHFTIISRFVKKKNLATGIKAYAIYARRASSPRLLHIFGSGELEPDIRAQIKSEGLEDLVCLRGYQQTAEICRALGSTLALIVPSTEEQFGIVAIEAQAVGVPVILSSNCGACDALIRTGINGFVVEPMNAEGYAFYMTLLAANEDLWRAMAKAADRYVWEF